jgi:hypothetical protein
MDRSRSTSPAGSDSHRSYDVIRDQARSLRSAGSDTSEINHSLQEFKNAFETSIDYITTNRFEIISDSTEGFYHNTIDLGRGKIIGKMNRRDSGNRHLSDTVYNQIVLASKKAGKDISEFDLKSWYGSNITNKETLKIAKEVGDGTYVPGDEAFHKILDSQAGKSKKYIASDHFPDKEVTQLRIITTEIDTVDIEYIYS